MLRWGCNNTVLNNIDFQKFGPPLEIMDQYYGRSPVDSNMSAVASCQKSSTMTHPSEEVIFLVINEMSALLLHKVIIGKQMCINKL